MNPKVGDVRVSYEVLNSGDATIIGKQNSNTFVEWKVPGFCYRCCCCFYCFCCCCSSPHQKDEADEEKARLLTDEINKSTDMVLFASEGHKNAATVVKQKEKRSFYTTYFFRVFGFIFLCVGLYLFLSPLTTLLPNLPYFGKYFAHMLNLGRFMCILVTAIILLFVIVPFCWFTTRPFASSFFIILGVVIFLLCEHVSSSSS